MTGAPRFLLLLAFLFVAGCGARTPPPAALAPAAPTVAASPTPAVAYGDPGLPIAGHVFGAPIHTQDAEELRYVVLQALTDRYAASHGIAVTQAEKQAHVAHMREALSQDPAVAATLGEESAEDQAARLEIAEAFILQWKVNRALYRQYGGRIIDQQGGAEPLDAYRKFLEERQAAGDFSIDDPAMAAAFWRYYQDDSIHSFFEPGSEAEKQVFAREPWTS